MQLNRRTIFILIGLVVLVVIYLLSREGEEAAALTTEVKKGEFKIEVTTTGELQAKRSEKIRGPSGLRKAGIFNIKITDLVDEGTYVKKGDYIGALDKTDAATKLNEINIELDKVQSQYISTRLDTALDLRSARDELVNLEYEKEEKKLVLEQSQFEPPATIRQAQIELEKSNRAYNQALENYTIKQDQAVAKMQEVTATLSQQQAKQKQILSLIEELVILAPKDGMLIYHKDWDGKKVTAGNTINPWNSTVATLPDLSVMISKTYVNEVDISKVEKDQEVEITIDAFPDNSYKGKVQSVANVGEQRPGSDAKVFEVQIELLESDSILRPAMTSNNYIKINSFTDVMYVPLEAVFSNDSSTYVFIENGRGIAKQEVEVGSSNENHIIIKQGLEEGQEVFLSQPPDSDEIELSTLMP